MKRIIRKYSNRRLYDTASSRMITLQEFADLVREGWEVQVLDQTTGEDITDITLGQALLELIKDRKEAGTVPLLLRELIKAGRSSIIEFIKNSLIASVEAIALTEKRARQLVRELVDTGRISQVEAKELSDLLVEITRERNQVLEDRIRKIAKEVAEKSRKDLEERLREGTYEILKNLGLKDEKDIERKVSLAVKRAINDLNIPERAEIEKFKKDIEDIREKLDLILKEIQLKNREKE